MAIPNGGDNTLNNKILGGVNKFNSLDLRGPRTPKFGTSRSPKYNMSYNNTGLVGQDGLPFNMPPVDNTPVDLSGFNNVGPQTSGTIVSPKKVNPGIVSSTGARRDLSTYGSKLDTVTNTPDPYLEYLQSQYSNLQNNPSQPGTEEQNAAHTGAKLQQKTVDDYNKYTAGLQALGIQSGLSQYAPGLQADALINAANQETGKLSEIQDKEDYAIAKAKQARLDKDSKALKDAYDEIRQYKRDKADELQRQLNKRTQDITVAKSLATQLYKDLQTLPNEQRSNHILEMAQANDLNPATLVAALADEQDSQYKFKLTTDLQRKSLAGGSSGSSGAYTKSQLTKLRAAGINVNEDPDLADAIIGGTLKPARGKTGASIQLNNKTLRRAKKLGLDLDADLEGINAALGAGYPIEYIGYLNDYDQSIIDLLKGQVK